MSEAYAEPAGTDEPAENEGQPRGFDLMAAIGNPNLAHDLDDNTLGQMGSKVCEEFALDEESRKAEGWDERYKSAMRLALQVKEEKSYPWPKASNVKYPLISTAAIQFNARAYPAIIDGPEIVKGAVKGEPTPEKQARAERVGRHMSWQLLEEMDDWEEDTDRLLMQLPIVGCAFRKTWFDSVKGYNCSHLVSAQDFVVNYWTKDLETCPRATHVLTFYPHEIREKMLAGTWIDADLGQAQDASNDNDAPHTFLEQHRLWDLDGDDYPEPYIVTVHKETQKVLRVVARFDERGIKQNDRGELVRIVPERSFTKYGFIPAPDGSFYDIGFGTLLNPLSETINSTINQLMDAGHLANLQAGFIGAGVSIKSGNAPFKPGEFKKADTAGGALKDNVVLLPTKEPSAVLFQLLGMLIEAAKDVTATQDILGGDAGRGTLPVGTVSALIEQGLKTFTAIVKRLHRALKKELDVLYRLNGRYLDPQVYFTFQDQQGAVAQADYAQGDLDIVPVSDPNMATDMQRMQQAQFVMEISKQTGAVPPRKAAEVALTAARVPEVDKLLGPEPGPPPPDPKMIEAHAKAVLDERRVDQEALESAAKIALIEAQTAQINQQMAMLSTDAMTYAENLAREAVRQAMGMMNGSTGQEVRPPDVRGMGQPPPDQGVPPPPQGSAGDVGGPMGAGPGDGPAPADQGPPDAGAINPQLG